MNKFIEWASGYYLTERLPMDMIERNDDRELEAYVSNHATSDYDCANPIDVLELIYCLASDINHTFKFKE